MKVCEFCGMAFEGNGRGPRRRFCSRNCQKRAWDNQPAQCSLCGGPCNRRAEKFCAACYDRLRHRGRELRAEHLVELWDQGLTIGEIAEAMGSTANAVGVSIVRYRAAGWDFPYRCGEGDVRRRSA